MKKLAQLGILALVLGFAAQSQAALLIEPAIGYSFGKSNFESDDNSVFDSDSDTLTGTSWGGRLGYQQLGFQLGVDYLSSSLSLKDADDDLDTTEWAGFVGFEFPVLLRVYAGYIFSGIGEYGDVEFSGGSGTKFGIGFTGLPFIDINIEYRRVTYEAEEFESAEIDSDYSAIMLGVSLPFTL